MRQYPLLLIIFPITRYQLTTNSLYLHAMYRRFRSAARRLRTVPLICIANAPVIGWKLAWDKRCMELRIDTSKANNLDRDGVVNRDRAKFHAQEAFVLRIVSCEDHAKEFYTAKSRSDPYLEYHRGDVVKAERFDPEYDPDKKTAMYTAMYTTPGIHFFLTPLAAYENGDFNGAGYFDEDGDWHCRKHYGYDPFTCWEPYRDDDDNE